MTATSVFFDTWAWFEIARRGPNGAALWKKYGSPPVTIHTSVLSLAEISARLAPVASKEEVEQLLGFVEQNSRIHGVTSDQARRAGPIRAELRRTRPGAGLIDALIVAAAEELGFPLLSGDRAFLSRPTVRTS